ELFDDGRDSYGAPRSLSASCSGVSTRTQPATKQKSTTREAGRLRPGERTALHFDLAPHPALWNQSEVRPWAPSPRPASTAARISTGRFRPQDIRRPRRNERQETTPEEGLED